MTLLDEFLKKKRQDTATKTVNMGMVQEAVGTLASSDSDNASGVSECKRHSLDTIINPYGSLKRIRRIGGRRCTVGPETDVDKSEGTARSLAQADTGAMEPATARSAPSIPKACIEVVGVKGPRADEPASGDRLAVEERRFRIENHATKVIDIPYTLINATRYLPAGLKKISHLFKILDTTYKFNQRRELSLVLVKYKDSIERLFKHRLVNIYFEQLNFIAGDYIEFLPVSVVDNGKRVKSAAITIKDGVDIDGLLYSYFISEYGRWAEEHGVAGLVKTIHPDFRAEEVELPRKPIPGMSAGESMEEPSCSGPLEIDKMRAKQAADSIYERIREKERLRREAFKNEQTITEDYEGKIDSLFAVGARRAIKLSDLVFQFGNGFGCREKILKSLKDKYHIRKYDDVEYVVKSAR